MPRPKSSVMSGSGDVGERSFSVNFNDLLKGSETFFTDSLVSWRGGSNHDGKMYVKRKSPKVSELQMGKKRLVFVKRNIKIQLKNVRTTRVYDGLLKQ